MAAETSLPIVFIVILLAITLGGVIYVLRRQRRQKQALARVAASLGNARHTAGNSYEGEQEGTPFRYWYYEGSRNSPPSFHVSIASAAETGFQLSRESAVHRFFKRLGISMEVQTGDRSFDGEVYIQSDDPSFVRNAFADHHRREAACRLLELGYTHVLLDKGRLEARIRPLRNQSLADSGRVEVTVSALKAIGDRLEQVSGGLGTRGETRWKARRAGIYGLSIVSGLVGALAYFCRASAYKSSTEHDLSPVTVVPSGLAALLGHAH